VTIAVIVPTLNEADAIDAALASIAGEIDVRIVIADGGSSDDTRDRAAAAGATVIVVRGGRGAQQNAGADAAAGELLLFLHADTRLPPGWAPTVRRILADRRVALGAFRLSIDGATWGERVVAAGANLRSRSWGLPYGDQALFLRRETFERLGGFAPLPIMEDWDLARRARDLGRIAVAGTAVVTSPRRWRRLGVMRTLLRNQIMLAGIRLGVPPDRLASFYRRHR
jgi:rSAM/selenodomain-associated transferase 2